MRYRVGNSRNQDMEIGALETVMEERRAVGWAWGVQLEQHQLKVAGGETLERRAGRAKSCRLAWGTAPVSDQSIVSALSRILWCAGAGTDGEAWVHLSSPSQLLPGKLL